MTYRFPSLKDTGRMSLNANRMALRRRTKKGRVKDGIMQGERDSGRVYVENAVIVREVRDNGVVLVWAV